MESITRRRPQWLPVSNAHLEVKREITNHSTIANNRKVLVLDSDGLIVVLIIALIALAIFFLVAVVIGYQM